LNTQIKFVFVATTVLSIFASASVLMGLISTGTRSISQEVSETAAHYSSTFLNVTLFLVFLAIVVVILAKSKQAPF